MRFRKILLVSFGLVLFAGVSARQALADGGHPLPPPPMMADGGHPLPPPPPSASIELGTSV
jgi:hypothetical protein